eukprot:m.229906 g.229906  ORF g.229906 m.229906 type:complete len:132 (-) comp17349_c0_seq1:2821-3216(-)
MLGPRAMLEPRLGEDFAEPAAADRFGLLVEVPGLLCRAALKALALATGSVGNASFLALAADFGRVPVPVVALGLVVLGDEVPAVDLVRLLADFGFAAAVLGVLGLDDGRDDIMAMMQAFLSHTRHNTQFTN